MRGSVVLAPISLAVAAAVLIDRFMRRRRWHAEAQAAIDLHGVNHLVKPVFLPEARVQDGKVFPLALGPAVPSSATLADRRQFVHNHRGLLLRLLHSHGSVLLRGWGAADAADFAELADSISIPMSDMRCSAGPRTDVASHRDAVVFTANEAPPSERIPFHHEMAQCDSPPSVVCFFCERGATTGGATPIVQSHHAARFLRERHPAVAEKLATLGVRYVRVMPEQTDPSSALGKSWRICVAPTADAAERKLDADGATYKWLTHPDGSRMLHVVTKPVPALLVVERTGREVFFTAAESTFNRVADEEDDGTARATSGAGAERVCPTKALIYGDGAPLDGATREALREVAAFMERERVAFRWEPGDALLIDNATVMHSRDDFSGPRRILASLVGRLDKSPQLREASKPKRALEVKLKLSPSTTMADLRVS